jgi:DNA-binding FadR family transcriptional regulator
MEIGIIEAPTVKQLFIEKIAGMIISGELKPGTRLPSERELAAQARISKSAVHFAMAELERLGFVETSARHGTYVADYAKTGTIETLSLLVTLNSGQGFMDRSRMEDMMEMRIAIEGKAVERLSEKINDADIAILSEDIAKSEQAALSGDIHSLARTFFDFHHDICFLSGNTILPLLFNSFRTVTLSYWEYAVRRLGSGACLSLQKDLFAVLKTKDAEASKSFLKEQLRMFMDMNRIG